MTASEQQSSRYQPSPPPSGPCNLFISFFFIPLRKRLTASKSLNRLHQQQPVKAHFHQSWPIDSRAKKQGETDRERWRETERDSERDRQEEGSDEQGVEKFKLFFLTFIFNKYWCYFCNWHQQLYTILLNLLKVILISKY